MVVHVDQAEVTILDIGPSIAFLKLSIGAMLMGFERSKFLVADLGAGPKLAG